MENLESLIRRTRKLFAYSPIPTAFLDFQGNIHRANRAFQSMFGQSKRNLHLTKIFEGAEEKSIREKLQSLQKKGQKLVTHEGQTKNEKGQVLYVKVNFVFLGGADDKSAPVVALFQDITRLTEAFTWQRFRKNVMS